jgi:hypothetical protein
MGEQYSMYRASEAIFWETAFYLIVALMLLLPDAPHAQRQDEEEIAPGDAHNGNA